MIAGRRCGACPLFVTITGGYAVSRCVRMDADAQACRAFVSAELRHFAYNDVDWAIDRATQR